MFYNDPMLTCILLSAGLSERFGSPKALAQLYGTTVIEHVQKKLLQTSCDEILVVLGAHAEQIQPSIFNHSRIRVVYNKDYILGQTSSVQAGWRDIKNTSTDVMFLPVDCPIAQSTSIDKVIHYFKENETDILIPCHNNKKGHPPVFSQRLRSKVLDLPLDMGLNSLFAAHPPQTIEINDPGIIKSFNTLEELELISRL